MTLVRLPQEVYEEVQRRAAECGRSHDVAVAVADRVEGRGSPAGGAASAAVANLVGRFGDHRGDTGGPQPDPVGAGRVSLVRQHGRGPGLGPARPGPGCRLP
jgi:hypothetical protein